MSASSFTHGKARLKARPLLRQAGPLLLLACTSLALLTTPAGAAPIPPTITYTGQVLSSGTPPTNGPYDFQFALYTAPTGGSQSGPTLSASSVPVAGGIFYVELDFGVNISSGPVLYLQTAYRKHGTTTYTTQTPRKLIPTTSYADYAAYSGSTHALYSNPLSATAPATGQVLQWNGSLWAPTTPTTGTTYTVGTSLTISGTQISVATGGITNSKLANGSVSGSKLALPLSASVSSSSDLLSLSNPSSGAGLAGTSASGYGVRGIYGAASGLTGYFPSGLLGDTNVGNGVVGRTSAGGGFGVLGITDTNGIIGVYGASANTNGTGVEGTGGAYGVYGSGGTYGVYGSGRSDGVFGFNTTSGSYGSLGGDYSSGVLGTSSGHVAVLGLDTAANGRAVEGDGDSSQSSNYAGIFFGNVYVVGTLSKAGGSFKIDDPLDPSHKTLSHSFVESPDMMNIYNGNITTDANGTATVTMPDYFEALNQDYRYQLTVIGQFAQAIVGTEIDGNQFTIKTDKPRVKVSWMVTGIRHDAWANANRIPVEEDKLKGQQGLYLNPAAFGLPESLALLPRHLGRQGEPSQPKPPTAAPLQQVK